MIQLLDWLFASSWRWRRDQLLLSRPNDPIQPLLAKKAITLDNEQPLVRLSIVAKMAMKTSQAADRPKQYNIPMQRHSSTGRIMNIPHYDLFRLNFALQTFVIYIIIMSSNFILPSSAMSSSASASPSALHRAPCSTDESSACSFWRFSKEDFPFDFRDLARVSASRFRTAPQHNHPTNAEMH